MFIMNMFPSDKINFLGFCAEETSENSTQIFITDKYYCYMTTDSSFDHCRYNKLWWTSRFSFQVLRISGIFIGYLNEWIMECQQQGHKVFLGADSKFLDAIADPDLSPLSQDK